MDHSGRSGYTAGLAVARSLRDPTVQVWLRLPLQLQEMRVGLLVIALWLTSNAAAAIPLDPR